MGDEQPWNDEISRLVNDGCDLADEGEHEHAAELFRQAIALGALWVGLNLGNSLEALGQDAAAEEAFRHAWIEGGDKDAGFNLARLIEDNGRVEEARHIFEALVAADYPKAMNQIAWFLRDDGDTAEAERMMRRAADSTDTVANLSAGILGVWRAKRGAVDEDTLALLKRGAPEYKKAKKMLRRLTD